MFYISIFVFLMFFGLIIQIFDFLKIENIYNKIIELNNDLYNYLNSIKNKNENIKLKSKLKEYYWFYNEHIIKVTETRTLFMSEDPFHLLILNDVSYSRIFYNAIEGLETTLIYNLSYYEKLKKKYFLYIFNPLLYLGNSINFILSSLLHKTNLTLPEILKQTISIFASFCTLVQLFLIIKELIK